MCRLRSLRSRKAAYTALRGVDEVEVVDGGRPVAAIGDRGFDKARGKDEERAQLAPCGGCIRNVSVLR
jgi:hypothetical protein